MRVAVTYHPPGQHGVQDELTRWFDNMPAVPRIGETILFDDRDWEVTSVSYEPDNDEVETPRDTTWYAELLVR